MFASSTFTEHVGRGVAGMLAIAAAVSLGHHAGTPALVGSVMLAIGALVALRGCPVCWTTGLIEMIRARRSAR